VLTHTFFFQADLDKPETLAPALKGAYGVFAVTNFLEKLSAEPEIAQGKAVADAAKVCFSRWKHREHKANFSYQAEGIQHFVWSSLLNVTKRMIGLKGSI
jgi:uncharacterized protein YbjT (DUF2867 family)